jgi:hypothetical protein
LNATLAEMRNIGDGDEFCPNSNSTWAIPRGFQRRDQAVFQSSSNIHSKSEML